MRKGYIYMIVDNCPDWARGDVIICKGKSRLLLTHFICEFGNTACLYVHESQVFEIGRL